MGKGSEFQCLTVYIDIDTAVECRDLANQIGVPASRLLAELLPGALKEARTEWRMLSSGMENRPDRAPEHPLLSLTLPPHVK